MVETDKRRSVRREAKKSNFLWMSGNGASIVYDKVLLMYDHYSRFFICSKKARFLKFHIFSRVQ